MMQESIVDLTPFLFPALPSTTTTTVDIVTSTTTTMEPPVSTSTSSSSTSTSTTKSTSTTTTICLSGTIYGKDSEELKLLRSFRDHELSKTPEGQEIIRLYYQWSPAIVKAIEEDEEFKEKVKEVVDGFLEIVGR